MKNTKKETFRFFNIFFWLHGVSYTKHSKGEPSVKILSSTFSVEFWRHCVLGGGMLAAL